MKEDIKKLDKVIHEKARLGIMVVLATNNGATFNYLKKELNITDGNLNSHLKVLEKEGYIKVIKKFVKRRPQTTYKITSKGRKKFLEYITSLEEIIKEIRKERIK